MAEAQSWQTVKGGKAVRKEPAKKKKKKEQSFIPVLLQDARELKSYSNNVTLWCSYASFTLNSHG